VASFCDWSSDVCSSDLLSFWLTAAMLFGAFAASLAAVEGGSLRDGTWNDRALTPRAL
jgi:hypothetical protein